MADMICAKLRNHWDQMSTDRRNLYLQKLFTICINNRDWQARERLYRCLVSLLDLPAAVGTLRECLAQVTNYFHDVEAKVRLAFTELLLEIQNRELFDFWEIVPFNHLVARLDEENDNMVGRALARLAFLHFCPFNVPGTTDEILARRMFSLLLMNRKAYRKLFHFCEDVLDTEDAVALIIRLLQIITNGLVASRRQSRSKKKAQSAIVDGVSHKKDNKERQDGGLKAQAATIKPSEPRGAEGLLDAVGVLWFSRKDALSTDHLQRLQGAIDSSLGLFVASFKDTCASSSLLFFASQATPGHRAVAPLVLKCKNLLVSSYTMKNTDAQVELLNLLVRHGHAKYVVESVLVRGICATWPVPAKNPRCSPQVAFRSSRSSPIILRQRSQQQRRLPDLELLLDLLETIIYVQPIKEEIQFQELHTLFTKLKHIEEEPRVVRVVQVVEKLLQNINRGVAEARRSKKRRGQGQEPHQHAQRTQPPLSPPREAGAQVPDPIPATDADALAEPITPPRRLRPRLHHRQ